MRLSSKVMPMLVLLTVGICHVAARAGLSDVPGLARPLRSSHFPSVEGFCSAYGSLVIPVGDFGDDDATDLRTTDAGFAGVGTALGFRYMLEFAATPLGLGWAFDASVVVNSFDKDNYEEATRNHWGGILPSDLDIDIDFWWLSFPMLTGPRVSLPLGDITLSATGLLGVTIARPPEVTASASNWGKQTFSYEMGPVFTMAVDAGLQIGSLMLGFRFLNGWNDDVDGEEVLRTGRDSFADNFEKDFPLSIIMVSAGIAF